jgi:SAM-dependent methyltransferase
MPARQGVVPWPPDGLPAVALADEAELPLPDLSVDRVLIAHGIEATENLRGLMRETWRILAGGGRLLAVVPNRRGIWARSDRTPFGHGHPYSASQLSAMLRDNLFVPERVERALFVPPLRSRFLLTAATAWEEAGLRWFERFAGVILVEATKQVYQVVRDRPRRSLQRDPVLVPAGAVAPARQGTARGTVGRAAADPPRS